MPRGTSMIREPGGRPARAERLQLLLARRALGVLGRLAGGGLVVGERLLARGARVVVAGAHRLLVRPDRELVGTEEVVARRGGGVVLTVGLGGGEVRARRHVGGLRLRLLLGCRLGGGVQRLAPRVGRVRPAAEHVRLPVVELELGGGAHLLDGALRVLHVGEADGDLIRPGALDLGLGHAERVGALADRVDRVVHGGRRDLRHLRRGTSLVHELDPALEVETELRGLGGDHHGRRDEQRQNDPEDRHVAVAVGHLGVSTRSSPPSSSYAGKMSAVADSARSPSACTVTGLSSTRTPHSRAVWM